MPHKRRGQEDDHDVKKQRAGGKRSRWSKQHLYLVLDDWDKGFSVHKIDADSFHGDSDSDDDEHQQQQYDHLAEPPVLRFEAAAGNKDELYLPTAGTDQTYLAASGTKMFIVMNKRCGLVYDAETAVLAVGTETPPRVVFGFGVCMPVGEVLYLLSYRLLDTDGGQHSFEAMSWSAAASGWSWKTLRAPPPTFTVNQVVVSHAVHPDGCTIFMTTANWGALGAPVGTYSFNTREATWRWHGECALPFHGQGHFDADLGAWVGLNLRGNICSCEVISPDFVRARPHKNDMYYLDQNMYLDGQITKEKLFCKEGCTIRASLTYMGASRFCLVECVPSKVTERRAFGDDDGCVLHVTIFGLKYNHKGELQTTNHQSRRSFLVSRHRSYFRPFALWA